MKEDLTDWLINREESIEYGGNMEEDINKLIEELTNVRPDELSAEGLKLFNKINEIIDKNKELEEFKKQVTEIENTNFIKYKNYIPVSLVEEKIKEYTKKIDIAQGEGLLILDSKIDVLQELLEKR